MIVRVLYLFAMFLLAAAPAAADEWVPLFQQSCVVATDGDAPFPSSEFEAGRATCGSLEVRKVAPRIWLYSDLSKTHLPAGDLSLVFKPTSVNAMIVREEYAGGDVVERRYAASELQDDWLPGGRGELRLQGEAANLVGLAIAVDGFASGPTLETLELASSAAVTVHRDRLFLLYGFFLALILLPLLYDLVFIAVLRERFIIWHAAAVVPAALYLVSSGGLLMIVAPEISLLSQWRLSIAAFVLAAVFTVAFSVSFLGARSISEPMKRAYYVFTGLLVVVGTTLVAANDTYRPFATIAYFASYIPLIFLLTLALIKGLRNDVRAAKFMSVAWLGTFVTGIWSILDAFGLIGGVSDDIDRMPYGMAWLTVISAVGVADRFMLLRRDRDQHERARDEFARLADTDLLTGLANRRRLEAEWDDREFDAILVVDLDHFKRINDEFGHEMGDSVIRAAAIALSGTNEEKLRVYRWGGEEFVVGIHARNPEEAALLSQAARQAVEVRIAARLPELASPVTASGGLARAGEGRSFEESFRAADRALLQAKRAGRNRLWVADAPSQRKHAAAPAVPAVRRAFKSRRKAS